MSGSLTSLMVLADSRLPAGGYAYSGGLEAAVAAGRVGDLAQLERFLLGRLATAGHVSAGFAAAACARPAESSDLDDGLDARIPSPALRRASRTQGRALLRAGRAAWPVAAVEAHQPVALGLVAEAAGLTAGQAASLAAYGTVAGPASAAVRLLGFDPYRVHALLAALAPACDELAGTAAEAAHDPVAALPAAGAPLLDISAEVHASWEVRLFAS